MGSGKSILQAEVVAQRMERGPVLVTAPLRKLVEQLGETIAARVGHENVGRYFTDAKQADRPVTIACHASLGALSDTGYACETWIADECHKTEAPAVLDFARDVQHGSIVGFSATPFRAAKAQRLSLFGHLIVSYSGRDAVADGVCVRPRVVLPDGEANSAAELDAISMSMIGSVGAGPGVVSAYTIDDAEQFAAKLGTRAAAIHSRTKKRERVALVERLRKGELDVLVYPNLLSEGVDMPWLRWMCMRRAVGSRVRFLQETGRVLRAYPGKSEGIVLDPHDLFGSFALTYDAMLGANEEKEKAETEEQDERTELGEPDERTVELVHSAERWLRRTSISLYYLGAVDQKNKRWSTASEDATAKQVGLIERVAPRLVGCYVPDDELAQLRAAYRIRHDLSKRGASDLIDAIMATTRRKAWPIDC
jgi:superfamily II DNA or RNA helicase